MNFCFKQKSKYEDLVSTIREYHAAGERLKIIPATAKRANNVNFEINLNEEGLSIESLLGIDFKSSLKPCIGELQNFYDQRVREKKVSYRSTIGI